MMLRTRIGSSMSMLLGSVLAGATGCADSHLGAECSEVSPCPDGLVCDELHGLGTERTCVPACDDGDRCLDGAFCVRGACSRGGLAGLGAAVERSDHCAFGLRGTSDYSAEPIVMRCREVCDPRVGARPDGCSPEEVCPDPEHACFAECTPANCPAPNRCAFRKFCTNERRFARADCDADGDIENDSGDCSPGLQCDAAALGGCSHPPREEL